MAAPKLAAVRGMNDVLPAQAPLWELFERRTVDVLRAYGYQQIRTPLVEPTALFVRGIGEATDIVEKEMYAWTDALNGDQLALRPEGTASVVRAALEHNLLYDAPRRLWYIGPMFRHERPQRGRSRQFHQVGVEALGYAGPDIDAEHLLMLKRLWDVLEIGPVRLELNTLGSTAERAQHRAALVAYLERHVDALDADARRRLHTNPLRVLDSKNPVVQQVVADAPLLLDHLGAESRAHFDRLQELLTAGGVAYTINPRLVRGLDYYNLTVFEWITDRLGAQGTICGGGRYDPLIEMLGGKPAPACGFALGIERVIELMGEAGVVADAAQCDVYVLHQGGATQVLAQAVGESLRDAGLDAIVHAGEASLKSQMKRADASGAEFAVIVGAAEAAAQAAAVKGLRERGAQAPFATQQTLPLAQLAAELAVAMERISE